MRDFFRCWSLVCALLGAIRLGAGAEPLLLSRSADPAGGGICAGRSNRHLRPPDYAGVGRGAGPVRRHREQAGRRRLYRLELRARLRRRTATRC